MTADAERTVSLCVARAGVHAPSVTRDTPRCGGREKEQADTNWEHGGRTDGQAANTNARSSLHQKQRT